MEQKYKPKLPELQYELFSLDETYPNEPPRRYSIQTKITHWGINNEERERIQKHVQKISETP